MLAGVMATVSARDWLLGRFGGAAIGCGAATE
jgi:hypothetical protein